MDLIQCINSCSTLRACIVLVGSSDSVQRSSLVMYSDVSSSLSRFEQYEAQPNVQLTRTSFDPKFNSVSAYLLGY